MDVRILIELHLLSLFIWWSDCPRLGQWEPLQVGFYVLLTGLPYSLSTSLLSGKIFQDHLYFPCQSLGISHFSRSSGYFYWRIIFGSLGPGLVVLMALGWHCFQAPSLDKARWCRFEYIHTYAHTHTESLTHIYKHLYLHLFLSFRF